MEYKHYQDYPDLYQIFAYLADQGPCVFLDSSSRDQEGLYSVLALEPKLVLKDVAGQAYRNDQALAGDFLTELQACLDAQDKLAIDGLPLVNPALGYFSYDFGCHLQGLASQHEKQLIYPDAAWTFYETYLVEDHSKGRLTLISLHEEQESSSFFANWERRFETIRKQVPIFQEGTGIDQVIADCSPEDYMQKVEEIIDYVEAGDTYVTNLSRRIWLLTEQDPLSYYLTLRELNPAPYAAYFNFGDFQLLSSSPELFLEVANGQITTRPIKGTCPRTGNPAKDSRYKKALEKSDKDRSELLMVTDLERNDLNRICQPGTVEVKGLFEVEAYATVYHLVSTVVGKLASDTDLKQIFEATFPGGSITGSPKQRTMEIIDELEASARGIYTGCLGYISPNQDMKFNIIIRSLVHQSGTYEIGLGGGITCESDPQAEYEETVLKGQALVQSFQKSSEQKGEDE
ncbi:aminodeoxychorismate synthase component I [Aerococcus sp. UMB7834]|uniref:aminodeoxychorismate synthase component I n=1 Tax=Aerococcus sp. UMB7834 TaxID=3046342 RepID=UPI00254F3671|nr:aminodeoxychorismate synthase component I [Aerococcus sp. UMB7834]MDK6804273.1 aminodeoxychorismate synthase component I [Aerococcus sp. UMB7834]